MTDKIEIRLDPHIMAHVRQLSAKMGLTITATIKWLISYALYSLPGGMAVDETLPSDKSP